MKYVSRYRGPSMGISERAKGQIVEGIFGVVFGLGGYAILQRDDLPTVEKVLGYGLAAVGGLIFMDAVGLPVGSLFR